MRCNGWNKNGYSDALILTEKDRPFKEELQIPAVFKSEFKRISENVVRRSSPCVLIQPPMFFQGIWRNE